MSIINVGIWGMGRAGYGMIRSELLPLPQFKIVAGCDLIESRAQKLAAETGAKAYTRAEDFLGDDSIDLVVVATRSYHHVRHAMQALRAGKNVLSEKPVATRLEDFDALFACADETGKKAFVRHNRRFDKHAAFSREVAAAGVLGDIYNVQIRTGGYNRRNDWQTIREFGGGQLFNWGPHCIDWALRLIGGRAVEIEAKLKRLVCAGDAEDYVKLLLTGSTGAIADIEISGASLFPQPLMLVQGTRGALSLDWGNYKLKALPAELAPIKPDPNTPADGAGFGNPEKLEWVESAGELAPKDQTTFWGAIHADLADGVPFPVSREQAREVIRVIDTAIRVCPL